MNLLTLIVLLPLAGFVLNGLAGPRLGRGSAVPRASWSLLLTPSTSPPSPP